MGINNKPINLNPPYTDDGRRYRFEYNEEEYNNFINSINWINEDITGKTIYLEDNLISQSKLRDKGFKITRSKDKADIILIDVIKANKISKYNNKIYCYLSDFNIEAWFDELINEDAKGYKYITIENLYKYLYKYEGNQQLYNQCDELFSSKDDSNIKMAMEFISNANWENNEIYLQELFNNHWEYKIKINSYKTSISFSGFLNSLNFHYKWTRLMYACDYKDLCKNDEHHQWVYNKYNDIFKNELASLIETFKIKIDKLEYSIDK